jgi:hypothetical protein
MHEPPAATADMAVLPAYSTLKARALKPRGITEPDRNIIGVACFHELLAKLSPWQNPEKLCSIADPQNFLFRSYVHEEMADFGYGAYRRSTHKGIEGQCRS